MSANPTPSQILAALRGKGVDVQTYQDWDTVGRPWQGPDGSPGLTGAIVHHTATASATGDHGCPSLYWAVSAYELPVCNLLVGRGPGDTYLLSAGSAYHCGDGGPVAKLGVPSRGFLGQTRFFGIEIDDPGTSTSSLTQYQVDNVGRVLAALAELCGWNIDDAIGTHKCYTDGCHGWNTEPSPCLGRKNDTIDGEWSSWPGSTAVANYNAPHWRAQAKRWSRKVQTWDGTVPGRSAVQTAADKGTANKAAWRVACRLYDLSYKNKPAAANGVQTYPRQSVIAFQTAQGWADPHGNFSENTQRRMFGKVVA